MSKRRYLTWLVLVAALSLVAAACEDEGDGGGGGPVEKVDVTVHFQGALTGDYNYLVVPAYQGALLRANELSADESFPANIDVVQGDTQGNPENAPPVVEAVVSDTDAVAVIGPAFSGESEASGDTYNEAGIPFVSPSATAVSLAEKGWDFWYRVVADDSGQGTLAGQYLAEVVGVQNVFVSHDKGAYGQPLAEQVRTTLEDSGVDVAGFEGIESGATDFSAFISDVEASGADALFFGGYDADFGKIVKQARDAGVDIDMMSADGSTSSTFLDLAADQAEGTHLVCPCNLGGDFSAKYQAEYGGEASSVPIYAGEGYDAMSVVGEGIRHAIEDNGATDAEGIRSGIKEYLDTLTVDNPYEGVSKEIAFDENHNLTAADPNALYYFYTVEGGEMTALGPAPEVLGG